jgi:lysophospholipase L1-like esterase
LRGLSPKGGCDHTLKNLLTVAVSLVISIVLGELVMSSFVERPLRVVLPEVRYKHHPTRWYTLLPNQEGYTYGAPFRVDDNGIRRSGNDGQRGSSRKVVALGDSFTFGLGVADDQTWPARLEQKLRGSHSVINAGTIGYGAFQIGDLVREKKLLDEANVVVYALYWNDYMTPVAPGPNDSSRISERGYFVWDAADRMESGTISVKRWLTAHSFILSSLRDLRDYMMNGPGPYQQQFNKLVAGTLRTTDYAPIGEFLNSVQEQRTAQGFELVVIILPVYDLMGADSDYDDIIRGMLETRGIPYLDAFRLFEDLETRSKYFLPERVDVHLNPLGYDVLATELHQMLVDNQILKEDRVFTSDPRQFHNPVSLTRHDHIRPRSARD